MNHQPIEHARDADIRLSLTALERAARRAREIAEKPAPLSSSAAMA